MPKNQRTEPHAPVTPPGQRLAELLGEIEMPQVDLAMVLGRSPNSVQDIIKRRKAFDIRLAVELEEALGKYSAGEWLQWELEYQRYEMEQERLRASGSNLKRRDVLDRYPFALDAIKFGWIPNGRNPDELLDNIESFLAQGGEGGPYATNYRTSGALATFKESLQAWTIQSHLEARRVRATGTFGTFQPDHIAVQLVPELQICMRHEADVVKVPEILARYGIAFIVVPNVRKAPVDGMAVANDGQPFIALTLRHGQLDRFWFVLLHELAHLACRHAPEAIEYNSFDQRNTATPEEKQADDLAAAWTLDQYLVARFIRLKMTMENIRGFADLVNRHPAIVLGRLKRDGYIPWTLHAREHPSIRDNFAGLQSK